MVNLLATPKGVTNRRRKLRLSGFEFEPFDVRFLPPCFYRSLMENSSAHGFDSDESDLDIQDESYGEHESIGDDLPKNLDFCVGQDEKVVESDGDFPSNVEALEPYIGMEFNSRD
ncbi:hypothetical protein F0562_006100 [Nyssa sinensis]|uniref:Uncharacterized protein n=1 Tax=Nyssa sinensis TaxID=561372 RepID=A0A5J5AM94_9ASTE|nr:hypothetical protein F0562_006100 [Nyssa sinensis]